MNKARPWVIKIVIPVEDEAFLYIGARTKEEAAEAAQEMLSANPQYSEATISDISEYQSPQSAPTSVSVN